MSLPRWAKAVVGGAVAAVVLLGFEGILRLVTPPPKDRTRSAPVDMCQLLPEGEQLTLDCPKGGRRWTVSATPTRPRVIVVGGSSVHSPFKAGPYDDFPESLGKLIPEIEVLNAGKAGASAGQVAALMPQLSQLSPSLIIVYTGHNDFALPVDRKGQLKDPQQALWQADSLFRRSRIYAHVQDALAPADQWLRFSEAEPGRIPPIPAEMAQACTTQPEGTRPLNLVSRGAVEGRLAESERNLEHSLHKLLDLAPAPVMLSTLARNFDHSPNTSTALDAGGCVHLSRCLISQMGPEARAQTAAYAETSCGPASAMAAWVSAHIAATSGDPSAALVAWDRSLRRDSLTLRAPLVADQIIAQVGQERAVPVVDLAAELGPFMPGEWFVDVLHLSQEGGEAVAGALAPSVRRSLGLPDGLGAPP